jgi:HPr kinase/phosphorylase
LLILGSSGSGKSALALQLMGLGCDLVSDDRTILKVQDGRLIASAPNSIIGKIEARGVGILAANSLPATRLKAAIDMDQVETERLPETREIEFLGCKIPVLHKVVQCYFPAALLQYLKGSLTS